MTRTPTATRRRPGRATSFLALTHGCQPLLEGEKRVDRDRGVIFGVRVCGLLSENKRRYTPEALRKAIPLYEGAKVKFDHPRRAQDERPVAETFGWLENVRQGDDGALYGDLHYLKSHEYAETVCEAAERNPQLFGLSHNADGKTHTEADGTLVVEEVITVRSVDLVDGPATNKSLFEAMERPMKTTPKKLLESGKLKPAAAAVITALMELDDGMGDMPMDVAPEAPVGDHKDDLVAAIGKLVQSTDPADHELAKKILSMLKPMDAAGDTETVAEEDDDKKDEKKPVEEACDPDKEKKDMAESKQLKQENAALKLCMESKTFLPDVQFKAMCALESADDMKAFVASLTTTKAPDRPRPRSQGPTTLTEANGTDPEIDYKKTFERLIGRSPASVK